MSSVARFLVFSFFWPAVVYHITYIAPEPLTHVFIVGREVYEKTTWGLIYVLYTAHDMKSMIEENYSNPEGK